MIDRSQVGAERFIPKMVLIGFKQKIKITDSALPEIYFQNIVCKQAVGADHLVEHFPNTGIPDCPLRVFCPKGGKIN